MQGNGPFLDWTARARSVPIADEIHRRGIKLNRVGDELVGPCPRCGGDDRFGVNVKKNIFNCRKCNVGGDVIQLVEHLDSVDFKTACETLAGPQPKANGKDHSGEVEIVAAEFQYHDKDYNTLLVVERIEFQKLGGEFVLKDGKRKKTFRQKRPDPEHPGKYIYNAAGVPAVPYKLPELLEAIASNHPVLIVEGEAKADLLWSWNAPATCCAGGAKKWKAEHSEYLRGANVFLLPDNDNAGWDHINKIGASLSAIAKTIRVVALPGLPLKGDVVDWAKADGTREKLDALLAEAPIWKLPTADDKAAAAKVREDELLEALLKAQHGLDFYRKREEVAKALEVPKAAIDAELQARRDAVPLHGHWKVVPWEEPVDGDSLLRDIYRRVRRHVSCTNDDALAIALWVMFSWVHEVAIHSPILLITSAEGESGKSTTLGLLGFLAPRALVSVEISKAALFRSIQLWQPSFVIDEFDTVMVSKDGSAGELRAVINSGHTRGQCVIRCVTDEQRPERFSTFAPKAIGMIGRRLPATTLGRSIIIELRRCSRDEAIERFKHEDDAELQSLRQRLRRWSMDNMDALQDVNPEMPKELGFRQSDNWRVLLAIAGLCSGAEEWDDKARAAAIRLEGASDKQSIGIQLLADIKCIFDEGGYLTIPSAVLVEKLKEDEEGPWAAWNHGKGLTQNSLATLLGGGGGRGRASRGGFGIRSRDVDLVSGGRGKGYRRTQFEEAWTRYLPPKNEDSSTEGGE
jgi:Protein of unknown function (DUF3631)/CHC2 zinc finger